MGDLIRREDALAAIVDERTHTLLQAWINVKKTVPSVDAVEVVRCRECTHREEYPCKVYHDDDWYCANGERKSDE